MRETKIDLRCHLHAGAPGWVCVGRRSGSSAAASCHGRQRVQLVTLPVSSAVLWQPRLWIYESGLCTGNAVASYRYDDGMRNVPTVPASPCRTDPAALVHRFDTASSSLVTSPAGAEALPAAESHGRFVVYPASQAQGAGSAGTQPDGPVDASRPNAEALPEAAEPRAMHRGRGFHSRTASLFGEDLTIADVAAPSPLTSMPATPAAATTCQPEDVLEQAAAEAAAAPSVASPELSVTHPGSTRSSSFSFPDLPGSLGGQQGVPGANGPEPDAQATLQLAGSEDAQLQDASSGSGGSPSSGKHTRRRSRSRIELPPWQS